ncbi:MAG: GNAT family protein [Clostridiaceae bacterium]
MKKLLEGKKVRLTAIEKEDVAQFTQWYNDTHFMRNYDVISAVPKNSEEVLEMLNEIKGASDKYIFAIRHIETGEFIGVTGFENVLWNNGTALIYIGLGNEEYRGQGIGEEAMYLTMEFGFEELNFHKIYLYVLEYNKPAINLYEKLGFIKEGVFREFINRDSKRHDMYLYGILKTEWEENIKRKLI